MIRPKILDLFCGAGGAAAGYNRAGFDVTGVDVRPQKNYPFQFIQADALEYLRACGCCFDVIHASPPCQAHTSLNAMWNSRQHANLIPQTRELLISSGKPFVIENVPGAPLHVAFVLCGTMFGLGTECGAQLRRHRLFETNWDLSAMVPMCLHSRGRVIGVYGGHGRDRRRAVNGQDFPVSARSQAMGIDWMTGAELSQAIPPAYTEWIGTHLLEHLRASA